MFGFYPLASGSKGNCIFINTPKTKILIDAGISAKAIQTRLAQFNVSLEDIDAVCITHEHSDHITGLKTLTNKYRIPIICNTETARAIVQQFDEIPRFQIFTTHDEFEWADVRILPFHVMHDAQEPVAFRISCENIHIGICTDLGFVTRTILKGLEKCHLVYVESNHSPNMVYSSDKPQIYKDRVLSRTGHLSNEECGELLTKIAHSDLKKVFLAHLSSDCNTPEVAKNTVVEILQKAAISLDIDVALQEIAAVPYIFS